MRSAIRSARPPSGVGFTTYSFPSGSETHHRGSPGGMSIATGFLNATFGNSRTLLYFGGGSGEPVTNGVVQGTRLPGRRRLLSPCRSGNAQCDDQNPARPPARAHATPSGSTPVNESRGATVTATSLAFSLWLLRSAPSSRPPWHAQPGDCTFPPVPLSIHPLHPAHSLPPVAVSAGFRDPRFDFLPICRCEGQGQFAEARPPWERVAAQGDRRTVPGRTASAGFRHSRMRASAAMRAAVDSCQRSCCDEAVCPWLLLFSLCASPSSAAAGGKPRLAWPATAFGRICD